MTVYGWDLSNHDWDRAHAAGRAGVSLADARRAGISFVTHKATEGSPAAGEYVDPYFDDFAAQLAHVAFPVAGSYHAAHRGHALAQADFWFDTVNAKYPGWRHHPCWIWQIDAEPLDGYPAPTKADILAIGRRIEDRAGVPADMVVVYGPRWVYGDALSGLPYRLWASNYADRGRSFKALYPGDSANHWAAYSGQTPLILQFTSGATIGAQHTCDANAIRVATEAALVRLFKPAPAPSPKPKPPTPTPTPVPAPTSRKEHLMIVVSVDNSTLPPGVSWPGTFTFDGTGLVHVEPKVGTVDNVASICHALGQQTPAPITYAQYQRWGGK